MAQIHPTATVDAKAELADDAVIGPQCVIDGPAVVGPECRLIGSVYLNGKVTLGRCNVVYPFVTIGFEPQDRKYDASKPSAGVAVGDNNMIREGVTIHRASDPDAPTRIGNDNFLMCNSHLGHDVQIGNHCTLANSALLGGHCTMADQVNIGGNSAAHQFCRIGRLGMLGGHSALVNDLPPFVLASGFNQAISLNVVGLRRSGVAPATIDSLKSAFDILYLSQHTRPIAIERIGQLIKESTNGTELLCEFKQFLESINDRGLVPHISTQQKHKLTR